VSSGRRTTRTVAATEAVVGHVYDQKGKPTASRQNPSPGTIDAVVVVLTTDCTPCSNILQAFYSMAVTDL